MEEDWIKYLEVLRKKWNTIPSGNVRTETNEILKLNDDEFLDFWNKTIVDATQNEGFLSRGWYHVLYAPVLNGKKVLDVGSGMGIDAITFAQKGANVTCVDIAESNLQLIERACNLLDVGNVDFCYLKDDKSLNSLEDYDFIWCQGSIICIPFNLAKLEVKELLKHLKTGGRWIELAYPKTRWEREGGMPFETWGDKTDGGAPWMEWYDLEKTLDRLSPANFLPVLNFELHNSDFIWFDLLLND